MVKKKEGIKRRFLVPVGPDHTLVIRERIIPRRNLEARRRVLKKAGFLENVVIYGRRYNEISRIENGCEVGLLAFSIKELKNLHILEGRKNHIKKIMETKGLSYKEAQFEAVRDLIEHGNQPGRADDYIDYYYPD
jgi:hypothetical protein